MNTAIVFIITLGLLIFVHELGHFLIARRNKIKVEEFGFGFPPRIFGFQILSGKKIKKIAEKDSVDIQISGYKSVDNTTVIKEKIIEKFQEIDEVVPIKKWRFIWGKRDTEEEWANKDNLYEDTIYSINLIPLGGFVKIKGEDGKNKNDKDSFSGKPAWVRIKVLGAGVVMNFILAWVFLSVVFMIGSPQEVAEGMSDAKNANVQIVQIAPNSPAEKMGIKELDVIKNVCGVDSTDCEKIVSITQFQKIITDNKDKSIVLKIGRGNKIIDLQGVPRSNPPEGEGPLGVVPALTSIVRYPWYEAVIKAVEAILNFFMYLASIIKSLFIGEKVLISIGGPIKIFRYTGQATELGLSYVLQFIAILSINLGIINALPFPALDGGRILFVLIEKIKGSPVSQKIEQFAHTFGFLVLMLLMIFLTFRDIAGTQVFDKIKNLF